MCVTDMQVGDVFASNFAYLMWLVLEMRTNGDVFSYRCLDLIDGHVEWWEVPKQSNVSEGWELIRA